MLPIQTGMKTLRLDESECLPHVRNHEAAWQWSVREPTERLLHRLRTRSKTTLTKTQIAPYLSKTTITARARPGKRKNYFPYHWQPRGIGNQIKVEDCQKRLHSKLNISKLRGFSPQPRELLYARCDAVWTLRFTRGKRHSNWLS